jgi:hypothetical protein
LLTPRELDAAQHIRHTIAGLQLELSMLRFELALKANFNPSQPRLPAGDPDGGQWTRVGGTGGAARRRNPPPSETGSGRPGDAIGSVPARSQVQDSEATADGWTVIGGRTDGVVREETVVHRDGSAIRAEVSAAPLTTGWDERYTVIGTDGAILTFQNRGLHQQVFDSTASLVAESRWSPQGATAEPTVQPVYAFAWAVTATVELGLTLFTWLSRGNTPDRQAVIAFSAREFRPNAAAMPELAYVGYLSRDEVEDACPRLGEVQMRTDDAVETVRRRGALDLSPTQFGTAVHMALKKQIDALYDPNFRAEVSALKRLDETYGAKGSVRIDVFENIRSEIVCIYDIKTGKSGLTARRAAELAAKAFKGLPSARQIIIIETRPTR